MSDHELHANRLEATFKQLLDGTLGPIRAAELEQHLDELRRCRALAPICGAIRDLAETLGDPAPPDHVWLQIAGRLRQEGRVTIGRSRAAPRAAVRLAGDRRRARARRRRVAVPRCPARPRPSAGPRVAPQGNAAGSDSVQSGVEDLRQAEQLLQSGVAKLKEGLGSDEQARCRRQMAATLDQNLQIIDQAIAESSAA